MRVIGNKALWLFCLLFLFISIDQLWFHEREPQNDDPAHRVEEDDGAADAEAISVDEIVGENEGGRFADAETDVVGHFFFF